MRRLSLGASLAIVAALAVPASAATTGVDVANFAFTPSTVHIAPGDTVAWTFRGPDLNHSVTATDGSFDSDPGTGSPLHVVGDTFSHTFDSAGTFSYFCKVHSFMKGTVVVGTGPAPTSDTEAPAVSGLKVRHRRAKFTLSEKASLKLTLKRSGGGKKSLARTGSAGANSIKLP